MALATGPTEEDEEEKEEECLFLSMNSLSGTSGSVEVPCYCFVAYVVLETCSEEQIG